MTKPAYAKNRVGSYLSTYSNSYAINLPLVQDYKDIRLDRRVYEKITFI